MNGAGRRWHAGQQFELDGLRYRISSGRKGPGDLRLDVWTTSGIWCPVRMRAGAVLSDFFFENEDVLYPPPAQGGKKYLKYLHDAATYGWAKADAVLQLERRSRGNQGSLW